MNKTLILLVLVSLGFTGCAKNYGNFINVEASPPGVSEALAEEAAKQISTLYPPAKTHIKFDHPTPDKFGTWLLSTLRSEGYAVVEQNASSQAQETNANSYQNLSLRYVVDASDKNLYRVMIFLDGQTLARAYTVKDNTLAPAGAWVRKE